MLPQSTESPPLCACGCGMPVKRSTKAPYGWNRRIAHHARSKVWQPRPTSGIAPLCACGCGQPVTRNQHRPYDWNTRIRSHRPSRPVLERFWETVNKNGPTPAHRPELGPCWVWTNSIYSGYGSFKIDGRDQRAHRVSWELNVGPIPAGQYVCHKCDNTACVRPHHLFLGDQTDNMRDAFAKGRMANRRQPKPSRE